MASYGFSQPSTTSSLNIQGLQTSWHGMASAVVTSSEANDDDSGEAAMDASSESSTDDSSSDH
eukprot:12374448-Prorocentrum_lima.AAC.1